MWDPTVLAALATAPEVDVTPDAVDGSAGATRTIWSIGVGDELYIRSWKGRTAVWFRDAIASGTGALAVTDGEVSQAVSFQEIATDAAVQDQISATFLTKYASDGYAGAMNEDVPLSATLRVLPR